MLSRHTLPPTGKGAQSATVLRQPSFDQRRRQALRTRRAVALISTTVSVILAAGVAVIILQLTLGSTRLASGRTDVRLASEAAETTRIAFETQLTVAPLYFYSHVSSLERARVCIEDADQVIQPDTAWPAACGDSWTYTTPDEPSAAFVEVTPPTSSDPRLTARILARSNGRHVGMTAYYILDSTARYTLLSTEDLDVSALPGGAAAAVSGELYAGGRVDIGATNYLTDTLSISSEDGYIESVDLSPLSANDVRFYGPDPGSGDVAIHSIRDLHATPITNLRSLYASIASFACPGSTPTLEAGRASSFCLEPGGTLVDSGGTPVAIPAATSFLLLPGGGGAGTVSVYWSDIDSEAPTTCGDPCDLVGDSAASLAGGTHPGSLSYWTALGDFPAPVSGLIYASEDVHIGLCGAGFTGAGCTLWSGSDGVLADVSLTVMAGSLLNPKDIYLSGPIAVDAAVSFGAVASSQIILPYWATTASGTMLIGGAYTGLGAGEDTAASVETLPVSPGATAVAVLSLTGSLSGTSVDTTFGLFDQVSLHGSDRQFYAPPPLYPASNGNWRRVETTQYTGYDRCGEAVCAD